MIFVTVGTERFPFDRLIRAVEALHPEPGHEELFMQIGYARYKPSCPYRRFLPFDEFSNKLNEARIVVAHAGAGTLLMCKQAGKLPIMMARKKSLGEHVDDHQKMLAERMAEQGEIICANTLEDLRDSIRNYDEHCRAVKTQLSDSNRLVHSIKELIDKLNEQKCTSL